MRKPLQLALSLLILSGCTQTGSKQSATVAKSEPQTAFTAGNELGMIPILEYHRFGTKEERWTRTFSNFEKDLEFLYINGYVLLSVNDFAKGQIDLPAGKKPVVITFDDGSPNQFRFRMEGGKVVRDAKGNPVTDPASAVGILDRFSAKHPDFGKAAAFYVLPNAFEESGLSAEKLRYLQLSGRQIGNHTYGHANLSEKDLTSIRRELSKAQAEVRKALPGYALETLALPYGAYPKSKEGVSAVLQGADYLNRVVLLVGANPAYSPYDRRFDSKEVGRIQAIDDEWKRWFNRAPGSTAKVKETFTPFVADGNPETVSFPKTSASLLAPKFKARGKTNEELKKSNEQKKLASPLAKASATPKVTVHPGYGLPLPKGGWFENGKVYHTVQSGEVLEAITNRYLKFTDYYVEEDLRAATKAKNGLSKGLSIGQKLEIPGIRKEAPHPKTVTRSKDWPARGLYMTATSAGSKRIFRLVREMKGKGINTVIFDAKDMSGIVSYDSKVPLARKIGAVSPYLIRDLPKMIDLLHREGIHVVARQTLFYDKMLANARKDLTVRSKSTGRPWIEQGSYPTWVDPSIKEVQDYNLALAKELVSLGIDEIQFDYIRFPAMGNTRDCAYRFDPKTPKHQIITGFLKRAYEELKPMGALLSIDVYGVVGWDQGIDVVITGQKLEELCHYTDIICPMLYSSHFYGDFDHKRYPPDEPYYFVSQGVKKFYKKTQGSGVVIRPWLQAFAYRVSHFNNAYIHAQLRASEDTRATGFSFWDAQNQYKVASNALTGWKFLETAKATP
ncbi:MAG: putative glycoside hydrolase [Bacteroidota bacterium]